MYKIINRHVYELANGENVTLCDIVADASTDLPDADDQAIYKIAFGSFAFSIVDKCFYCLNSSGTWTAADINASNISSLAAELHALLPDITASTTIKDYVDSLSKGAYTVFIANVSNPSDSPINANCFVNIYVYSGNTAAVELIPISNAEMSRTYTMRKVGGVWREWYRVEGTPVASSTQS